MRDTFRSKFRTFLDRMMAATRVLPATGFGRTPDPPTDAIRREALAQEPPTPGALDDQQHVDVPSRAIGQRPRA